MSNLVEKIARALICSRGAPLVAGDKEWAAAFAHYKRMDAEHGEAYTAGHSLVNDALRDARACLSAIEAEGMVIVPKPVWNYERGKPVTVTECPYCRATDGRHYNSCQRPSGTIFG